MSALPWREPKSQGAPEREHRSRQLRMVLGPPEGWPEDWKAELYERLAIAELHEENASAEQEVTQRLRAELLGRLP